MVYVYYGIVYDNKENELIYVNIWMNCRYYIDERS